jgi:hypothetical protein
MYDSGPELTACLLGLGAGFALVLSLTYAVIASARVLGW